MLPWVLEEEGAEAQGAPARSHGTLEEEESAGASPPRGLFRLGASSLWIVIALLATCYRACTGPGG